MEFAETTLQKLSIVENIATFLFLLLSSKIVYINTTMERGWLQTFSTPGRRIIILWNRTACRTYNLENDDGELSHVWNYLQFPRSALLCRRLPKRSVAAHDWEYLLNSSVVRVSRRGQIELPLPDIWCDWKLIEILYVFTPPIRDVSAFKKNRNTVTLIKACHFFRTDTRLIPYLKLGIDYSSLYHKSINNVYLSMWQSKRICKNAP